MDAYALDAWRDFAVGVAGAAAALAGLLFVAISINLQAIIRLPRVPGRAALALVLLASPIFLSMAMLIPQGPVPLGVELLAVAAVVGPLLGYLAAPRHRPTTTPVAAWALSVIVPTVVLEVGTLIGGVGLVTTSVGGLFWIPAAVALALAGGLFNAWVLMIEIIR